MGNEMAPGRDDILHSSCQLVYHALNNSKRACNAIKHAGWLVSISQVFIDADFSAHSLRAHCFPGGHARYATSEGWFTEIRG